MESVPEQLLETFPHDRVVAAARRAGLTARQLEGAARFFCRSIYDPVRKRKGKRPPVPADVRDKLWAHLNSIADPDKLEWASNILGPDELAR